MHATVYLQEMFPNLPFAAALAVEMHLSMSVKIEDQGTLDLKPLDNLFAAAGTGWYASLMLSLFRRLHHAALCYLLQKQALVSLTSNAQQGCMLVQRQCA